MARPSHSSASFSARRRWGIFFSVLVSIAAVLALVVMLNYLGTRYFLRFNWSPGTTRRLSPRTLGLLQSITNDVKVLIYYDKEAAHYADVNALLKEYQIANPRISVQTVDYIRDADAARRAQAQYHLTSVGDQDQVIFDCKDRPCTVSDRMIWEYGSPRQLIGDGQPTYEQTLKAFRGEQYFSAALLNVINPHPFNACYLFDDAEHVLEDKDDPGYWRFQNLLALNNILTTNLHLADVSSVPADCDLLIIAGPQKPIGPMEVKKIRQYLLQGGSLLVLFNNYENARTGRYRATGLEPLLAEFGVAADQSTVKDGDNTTPGSGAMMVRDFNGKHPISAPFHKNALALVAPRSVGASKAGQQDSDTLRVSELAWTGPNATLTANNTTLPSQGKIPLAVAVEKSNAKAGLAENTPPARIVAVGDSLCLDNQLLAVEPQNGEFAELAVNWLLYRPQLMGGVDPQPVTEYKLTMTNAQIKSLNWIFLAGMPGGVLAFGFLVWLRRRR